MRIYIINSPKRVKQRAGDRKIIHGIEHVRQQVRVKHGPHTGALVVSNGRPVYQWVQVEKGGN